MENETSILVIVLVAFCIVLSIVLALVLTKSYKKEKLLKKYLELIQLDFDINPDEDIKIKNWMFPNENHSLKGFLSDIPEKDLGGIKKYFLDKIITLICTEINKSSNDELIYSLSIFKKSIKFLGDNLGIIYGSFQNIEQSIVASTHDKIFEQFKDYLSNLPNYIMIDAICDYLDPEKPTDEEGRLSTIFLITGYANRNPETPYRETAILIRNKKIQEFLDEFKKENIFDQKNYKILMEILAMDSINPKFKTNGETVLYQIALDAIDDLQNKPDINVENTIQIIKDLDCIISNHKQIQQGVEITKSLGKSINQNEENFLQENPFG